MMNSKKVVVADTEGVQKESDILAGECIAISAFFAPAEEVIVKVKI